MRARPALLYAAAAALALVELAILAVALHPNVSDTYRARYIAGTSNCWLTNVSGEIRVGERLPATREASGRIGKVLRCGWLPPESYGTWSDGEESKFRLKLEPGGPDLFLDLELFPLGANQGHAQRVTVSADGIALATFTLDRPMIVARRIPIPASLPLDADNRLELDVSVPTAVSPQQLGLNDLNRRLGIRLVSLRLWAP